MQDLAAIKAVDLGLVTAADSSKGQTLVGSRAIDTLQVAMYQPPPTFHVRMIPKTLALEALPILSKSNVFCRSCLLPCVCSRLLLCIMAMFVCTACCTDVRLAVVAGKMPVSATR